MGPEMTTVVNETDQKRRIYVYYQLQSNRINSGNR